MNEMNVLTVNGASFALRDMLAQDMLADICSGYNGVAYPDAGEAVRKQCAELAALIRQIAAPPGDGQPVNLFDKDSPDILKNHFFGSKTVDMTVHNEQPIKDYHISAYIPVKEGRCYTTNRDGAGLTVSNQPYTRSFWYYDKNKEPLSRPEGTMVEGEQYYTTTAPMGAAYARVDFFSTGATIMFVEGDTFPETYIAYDPVASQPVLQLNLPAETLQNAGNPLHEKTAVFAGDSICEGNSFGDTRDGYAGRIAAKNAMQYKNFGTSGATLTEKLAYYATGAEKPSVSAQIEQMYAQYPEADYIVLEGGTNDADLLGSRIGSTPARFGAFTPGDFSGNYDQETFCGALESILYRATHYWKGKKIGFVIAHKMGISSKGYSADVHNRRAYFETAMEICKKWGVPVLNLWDGCNLNPSLVHQYVSGSSWEDNAALGSFYADGQHLLPAGYDYVADIIGNWMKTL